MAATVTKFASSQQQLESLSKDFSKFLPNILDSYDSPTYHFRFFMVPQEMFCNRSFGSEKDQIVIAETGVTANLIQDVEIDSVIGTSSKATTSRDLKVSFKIIEPANATLLDQLWAASIELGIENWTKGLYFLELTFKGRDRDTSNEVTNISGKKWVFPLQITNCKIKASSEGSEYDFEAIRVDNFSSTLQISDLTKNFTATGGTIGELVTALESELNRNARDITKHSFYTVADEYIFEVDPGIVNEKVQPKNLDANPERYAEYGTSQNGKTTVSFHDGTDIRRVLDSIITCAPIFQEKIKGTTTQDRNDADDKKTFKKMYRIYTQVDPTAYDQGRGDYARRYTWKITTYEMSTVQASPFETSDTLNSKSRIQDYIDSGRIKKRYDYIFTGLNQSIEDFELDFQYAWYCAMPRQGGQVNNYANHDVGRVKAKLDNSIPKNDNKATSMAKFNSTPTPDMLAQDVFGGTNVYQSPSNPVSERITSATERKFPNDKEARVKNETKTYVPTYKYAEQGNLKKAREKYQELRTSYRKVPLSYIETNQDVDSRYGIEEQSGAGRTLLSTIFTQAMNGSDADLQRIELSVKGDPYWFGSAPLDLETDTIPTLQEEMDIQLKEKGSQNIDAMGYQKYFLFTTRTPERDVVYGDDGNEFTDNSVINGVYGVISVTSTFSEGIFKQKLTGVRDPLTDTGSAYDVMDSEGHHVNVNANNVDALSVIGNKDIREAATSLGGTSTGVSTSTVAATKDTHTLAVQKNISGTRVVTGVRHPPTNSLTNNTDIPGI